MSSLTTKPITMMVLDIESYDVGDFAQRYGHEAINVLVKTLPAREIKLSWVDPSFHDGASLQEAEKTRAFEHLGSAITWARRQIFHGKVFGDVVDLELIERRRSTHLDGIDTKKRQFAIRQNGISELSFPSFSGRELTENKPARRIRPAFRR
ncbi:hypothetical protein D869_gp271 [Caulobacter phage CcrRogue]|uniref:Uncharacterized protein n=1 Tax=Caulobacter phage CcrRogue TaxID=2927986 RepID=K4JSC2_9CAUD|nr:hypothetical protein D869_gp271 [Caulobacter phage CcrRogue]AFU86643.1 hypothetical protein CcrRogue_gp161 [Caulobacter phage CcrRogue]